MKICDSNPEHASNNFKFKTVSGWNEVIKLYKGLNWQRGETKDLIIKKSSFVHFLSFDYQPLFGKWVCAHWGTNSRKRRELILLTTYAKIVGFGAARDVKPIRPLVKFFRKYLTIFSSTFSLVLLRSMPLSWVTLVSFAVVLFVARIIYDISEKSRKLLKINDRGCLQKYLLTQ